MTVFSIRPFSLLAVGTLLAPGSVFACATCYGQSDSPMAAGMNWGILSLLAMIVTVLGGVGAFFIFLARRSASMAAGAPAASCSEAEDVSEGEGTLNESRPGHRSAGGRFASAFAWRNAHCGESRLRSHRGGFVRAENQG